MPPANRAAALWASSCGVPSWTAATWSFKLTISTWYGSIPNGARASVNFFFIARGEHPPINTRLSPLSRTLAFMASKPGERHG